MSGSLPPSPWQGEQEPGIDSETQKSKRFASGPRSAATRPEVRTHVPQPVPSLPPARFANAPASSSPHSRKKVASPPAGKETSPRFLLEALVVLAIAVTVFRAFLLEGFMISTGSMAPALWGYHHRITCPDCGYLFPVSASDRVHTTATFRLKADETGAEPPASADLAAPPLAMNEGSVVCPNCRYSHIQLSGQIVHEGDQLLVEKQAFQWQPPQRWNAVVFRNPRRSVQAYAKRIIGLPGEIISLREGDVYVKEVIQRKTLAQQRELRILVSDSRFQPQFQDANWQPHWQPASEQAAAVWQESEVGYRYEPAVASTDTTPELWLNFSHWVRQGGSIKSVVPLERWPADIPLPTASTRLHFDPIKQTISCQGALPADLAQKLQTLSTSPPFQQAIQSLFVLSHQQPITDQLAYNPRSEDRGKVVRDLMVELELLPDSMQSQFKIRMHDGQYAFVCQLDLASRTAQLTIAGHAAVLRTGNLPELQFEQPLKVEMSLFDRQVLLAVNDVLVFEPYAFRPAATAASPARIPVAISATGAPLQLLRQRVYRDVYYRQVQPTQPDTSTPVEYRLGPEEYFVLGDNSAVSVDSRHWPAGSVTHSLLIGRPVILHLPSRKAEVAIGPYTTRIRVPDLDRVRLLH